MPKTETDDYISRVGFEGQLSIIFVDEFSRWTIVVPLRNLKEDDFISAFMVFQSELVKMMRKYQNNQSVKKTDPLNEQQINPRSSICFHKKLESNKY